MESGKRCNVCDSPLAKDREGRGGQQPNRRYCSIRCKQKARLPVTTTPVKCEQCGRTRLLKHPELAGTICRTCAALKGSRAAAQKLASIPIDKRLTERRKITESGCWEWQGYAYSNGYGAIGIDGSQRLVHRVSYETFVGPIPEGLVLDHLCKNKICFNPAHLEPVTGLENTRRAMRSACVNGHDFTQENTWVHRGKRYCRACRRQRSRYRNQRTQAA